MEEKPAQQKKIHNRTSDIDTRIQNHIENLNGLKQKNIQLVELIDSTFKILEKNPPKEEIDNIVRNIQAHGVENAVYYDKVNHYDISDNMDSLQDKLREEHLLMNRKNENLLLKDLDDKRIILQNCSIALRAAEKLKEQTRLKEELTYINNWMDLRRRWVKIISLNIGIKRTIIAFSDYKYLDRFSNDASYIKKNGKEFGYSKLLIDRFINENFFWMKNYTISPDVYRDLKEIGHFLNISSDWVKTI